MFQRKIIWYKKICYIVLIIFLFKLTSKSYIKSILIFETIFIALIGIARYFLQKSTKYYLSRKIFSLGYIII